MFIFELLWEQWQTYYLKIPSAFCNLGSVSRKKKVEFCFLSESSKIVKPESHLEQSTGKVVITSSCIILQDRKDTEREDYGVEAKASNSLE